VQENIIPLVVLLHAIGQFADAPFFRLIDVAALAGYGSGQLLDERIDFFIRGIGPNYKQFFVNSLHSSSFEPWARRLNFVMDFSTPSAIMDSTA